MKPGCCKDTTTKTDDPRAGHSNSGGGQSTMGKKFGKMMKVFSKGGGNGCSPRHSMPKHNGHVTSEEDKSVPAASKPRRRETDLSSSLKSQISENTEQTKNKAGAREKDATMKDRDVLMSKASATTELVESKPLTPHTSIPPQQDQGGIDFPQASQDSISDDPITARAYKDIPVLEPSVLPRGGISVDTEAVGRVQFGIPPETIKDSMRLGLVVPTVYIVPVERFCREIGPALGANLAEFEFPAYFNFFVLRKRCTLIVDSEDAERSIRSVFGETLLGPEQFRRNDNPMKFENEDFDPSFPDEMKPKFDEEFRHFRIMPDGKELELKTLLKFAHFSGPGASGAHKGLGVLPHHEEKGTNNENGRIHEEGNDELWTYSQTKWIDVSTVFPDGATAEETAAKKTKRIEIFKMPGGSEYILHDINENNIIVGKARFAGHVEVSEFMEIDGFGGKDAFAEFTKHKDGDRKALSVLSDDDSSDEEADNDFFEQFPESTLPPTFHPPSFGLTVLGNAHGFEKNGSTSGYVLWINGRGLMIDPPPYSSGTLEREGIRPSTIVGIVLTHCHADHDAGAFQKILTGSPVCVLTTPTIYKSFIRKYAALSDLKASLLQHSHRYIPAIIGTPLRFQGATFHFIYTLHTIPCIGFRVEWRGRSMVFTGDHLNSPPAIDKLQQSGVLSKARADHLRKFPLEDTDLLLHESGAPPIHTPLDVLMALPKEVKDRLYVVHTSALPEGCELRVAPTGTAGTIRLDQLAKSSNKSLLIQNEYDYDEDTRKSFIQPPADQSDRRTSLWQKSREAPLVSLRPASSTDAWFILNLLCTVPFLSSLSYSSTMELLEIARVDAFCWYDVVVPMNRRRDVLCVVWEGTCMERDATHRTRKMLSMNKNFTSVLQVSQGNHCPISFTEMKTQSNAGVWHAGDWTAPGSLQPDKLQSGESKTSKTHDIVVMSKQGAKVITVEFSKLHAILKSGSALYRRYLFRENYKKKYSIPRSIEMESVRSMMEEAVQCLNLMEIIEANSALVKLGAVQKRHLECLAEGPVFYQPGEFLWRIGSSNDQAFLIVSGTVSLIQIYEHAHMSCRQMSKTQPEKSSEGKEELYDNSGIEKLHNRQVITKGDVSSRGHFLCDIANMFLGWLTEDKAVTQSTSKSFEAEEFHALLNQEFSTAMGNYISAKNSIHESTLVAGEQGCVAVFFPKSSLLTYFDKYPGVLLSMLGKKVVV